ncbi:hypothetical protein [Megalodesulfovibrio paquesii]
MMHCAMTDTTRTPHSRAWLIAVHLGLGVGLAAALSLGFGWVVMLLWNVLMPDLFALPAIGYWQGVGLLLLTRILTGGLGLGGHSHHTRRESRSPRQEYDDWWRQVGEQTVREQRQDAAGERAPR